MVRCNTRLKRIILWSPPYETLHVVVYASRTPLSLEGNSLTGGVNFASKHPIEGLIRAS